MLVITITLLALTPLVYSSHLLSRGRRTLQNNVEASGTPGRAVDGNYQQHYGKNSCTHTHNPANGYVNWWYVDLGGVARVDRVRIWNRGGGDCCAERIDGGRIYVDDQLCGEMRGANSQYEFHCGGREGRFVRIVNARNPLTLCEVEVYGTITGDKGDINKYPQLLSAHKPTSQSSTQHGAHSGRAVDRNYNLFWNGGSCTATNNGHNNWWQVDLQKTAKVDVVVLHNRFDCCRERMANIKTYLDNQYCGSTPGHNVLFWTQKCHNKIGSKIKLVKDNGMMTLCEVHVLGIWYVEPTDPPTDPPTEPPTDPPTDPPTIPPTDEETEIPTGEDCKDELPTCLVEAEKGNCLQDEILQKCPYSCHQCVCGDNIEECETWAENSMCESIGDVAKIHCRESCNFCTNSDCVDIRPDCGVSAMRGECFKNQDSMAVFCRKSCKLCEGMCEDTMTICPDLSALCGMPYGNVNCPFTCNTCDKDAESSDDEGDEDLPTEVFPTEF